MTTAPKRIDLPPFPGGKRIAVTTSWDDGRVYDRWVVDTLNSLDMKGTFNLNSRKLTRTGTPATDDSGGYLDAGEVATLYAGHEVAVHTASHPRLERLNPTQIAEEVLEDRQALEELVGYPVRGMAYPYGSYNQQVIDVLRNLEIAYSRTTAFGSHSFPPAEPLTWATTMHFLRDQPGPLPDYWESYYTNVRQQGLFFVWGHSYEVAHDRDALTRIFTPMAHKPDVWYCTNIELYDYESARRRLVIAANKRTCYNPSACPVTILVDGTLRDVPPGLTSLCD